MKTFDFGPLRIDVFEAVAAGQRASVEHLAPLCPDCRALWERWGTEQPCAACEAEDARAFAAGEIE